MKLRDFITRLEIDPKKLINYALDPENPVGGDKAIVFANRLGYTQANYQILVQQIHAQALDAEATPKLLEEVLMTPPELFDVVELLVGLPENNLQAGAKGAIVEIYSNQHYEIEFTNNEGETLTHLALPATQFVVVWKAVTKTWVHFS